MGADSTGEPSGAGAGAGSMRVYFGTYTGGKSRGIYLSQLDGATGRLGEARLVAETPSPSFLAFAPGGKRIYAVNELDQFGGEKGVGSVSAFDISAESGDLKLLNVRSSRGAHPCHLTVDATGRWVLVANYSGGNLAVLPVAADGTLGEAAQVVRHEGWSRVAGRQEAAHAHSINLDAANRFAVAADLGIDKLMIYAFDAAEGKLTAADVPAVRAEPGSGPRHFAFHPDGRRAYVINELNSTLTALTYNPKKGEFGPGATLSTLPEARPVPGNSTAEVQVHPSGRFVYGSNRGHNSIAVFKVGRGGRLEWVENEPTQGRTPRNFGIDPTGRWLLAANQDSDSVVVFRIDEKTGALEATGQQIEVGRPVCVKFLAE
jgi:6-phosphogluconolactonase